MKKILVATIIIASIITIAISCKKETVTVTETSPINSQPFVIHVGKYYSGGDCKNGWGMCITDNFISRTQFADYKLQLDEAKGESWAEQAGQDVNLKMLLTSTAMSTAMKDTLVFRKKMYFVEDTYIKESLINSTYKKAGISKIPSSIKIPRGVYPVTVTGKIPANPSSDFRIIITITITLKANGEILITIKIEVVDP